MMLRQLTPLFAMLFIFSASANTPTNEEIYQMMMELKKEIAELKAENKKLKESVEVVEESVDDVVIATDEAIKAQEKKASKYSWGGYGELHGNWLDDQKGSDDTDQMDFHRFVLYFNYEYSEKLRFVSELELEHSIAGDGQEGEIELEQAYIQYDINDSTSISSGLFLMPVGILNETHEPDTFYGVERNDIEKNIIPTTWWEGGALVSHNLTEGLNLKASISSGLKVDATGANAWNVRKGRQKVSNATAKHLAYTAALKYTAIPGFSLGGSLSYQDDIDQGTSGLGDDAILSEVHFDLEKGNYGLRAMYARWDINGSGPESTGQDEQFGWFVEPSYKTSTSYGDFGFFGRYSVWDNKDGSGSTSDTKYKQINYGVNWWIHPQVVFKADWQDQDVGSGITKELDGLNLGVGYSF